MAAAFSIWSELTTGMVKIHTGQSSKINGTLYDMQLFHFWFFSILYNTKPVIHEIASAISKEKITPSTLKR